MVVRPLFLNIVHRVKFVTSQTLYELLHRQPMMMTSMSTIQALQKMLGMVQNQHDFRTRTSNPMVALPLLQLKKLHLFEHIH